MRVTESMIAERFLYNLQTVYGRLARQENVLATGVRIHRPSDDPPDADRAMRLSSQVNDTEQRVKNAEEAITRMNLSDAALMHAVNVLQRVRELAIYGASSTVPQASRDAMAAEVNQAVEELVQVGNTRIGERYIFAGDRTLTAPFTTTLDPVTGEITAVTYVGTGPVATPTNPGALQVDVGDRVRVQTNVTGDVTLLPAVQVAIQIRDDLRAANLTNLGSADLQQIDQAISDLLRYQAELGARTNRIQTVLDKLLRVDVDLQGLLGETMDADIAKTVVELQQDETVYRAALASGARLARPTLLDFLQ